MLDTMPSALLTDPCALQKKKKKKHVEVELAGDDALLPESEPGSPETRV